MFDLYVPKYELVRLGNDTDGGYIFSNITDGFDLYISPGIGPIYDITSDKKFMDHFGITNYITLDGTTTDFPNGHDPNYIAKNISFKNSENTTNLENEIKPYSNILMQMDIEGGEWEWLQYCSYDNLMKFKQIVIEFHWTGYNPGDTIFLERLMIFKKLIKTHRMVHAHGNNCHQQATNIDGYIIPHALECTFVRKDYATDILSTVPTPLPIDIKNRSDWEDVPFINIHATTI